MNYREKKALKEIIMKLEAVQSPDVAGVRGVSNLQDMSNPQDASLDRTPVSGSKAGDVAGNNAEDMEEGTVNGKVACKAACIVEGKTDRTVASIEKKQVA